MRLAPILAVGLMFVPATHAQILITPGAEGEDTSVYSFVPGSPRDANTPNLYAFSAEDATSHSQHVFRTLLRFPLPAELAGACVTSSTLIVYFGGGNSPFPGETEDGEIWLHPVLGPWTEGVTTWNNQPPIGAVVDTVGGLTTPGVYIELDATSIAQGWANGGINHGFALTSPTGRVIAFPSFEAPVDPLELAALAITLAEDPLPCPEPGAIGGAAVVTLALARVRARRR